MALYPELVSGCIDVFPNTDHVSGRMDYIYYATTTGQSTQ